MNRANKTVELTYEEIQRNILIAWWNTLEKALQKKEDDPSIGNIEIHLVLKSGLLIDHLLLTSVDKNLPIITTRNSLGQDWSTSLDEVASVSIKSLLQKCS